MRILFIGELDPHSRTFQRKRVLEEIGCDVTAYSTLPEHVSLDGTSSVRDRILWKIGFPPDLVSINKAIVEEVRRSSPDVLWIEKGNTICPKTLKTVGILAPSMKIVSFAEDDMFALHNRSWFYTLGLKHYSVVFTTKSYNSHMDELPSLGAKKVVFVDNTYDIHTHRPLPVTPDDKAALGADVGFIGTYEKERAESLLHLAKNGIAVRIWGNGWQHMSGRHPNMLIEGRAIYGDSYIKSICSTRINLCFLRKANRDRQTCRSLEIPACGAFMLAERTHEHLCLLREGVESAYFDTDEELLRKVQYYTEHETERKAIAAAGRQRCETSGYSHYDRMRDALQFINSILPSG